MKRQPKGQAIDRNMETKLKNDDLVSYKMQASNNRP